MPGSWPAAAAMTGVSSSYIVSMPPMPQPMKAPVSQSTGEVLQPFFRSTLTPDIRAASTAAMTA